MTGDRNPNWNGGVYHHGGGYRAIKQEDGSYELEHRVVMSQHLGRPLLPDEHVHHINGEKTDNRIENLQILSVSDHAALHARERKAHSLDG